MRRTNTLEETLYPIFEKYSAFLLFKIVIQIRDNRYITCIRLRAERVCQCKKMRKGTYHLKEYNKLP